MAQQIQPQFIQMPKQQDDWLSSVFGLASAIPGVGPWVSGLLGLDSLFGGKKEEPKPIYKEIKKIIDVKHLNIYYKIKNRDYLILLQTNGVVNIRKATGIEPRVLYSTIAKFVKSKFGIDYPKFSKSSITQLEKTFHLNADIDNV